MSRLLLSFPHNLWVLVNDVDSHLPCRNFCPRSCHGVKNDRGWNRQKFSSIKSWKENRNISLMSEPHPFRHTPSHNTAPPPHWWMLTPTHHYIVAKRPWQMGEGYFRPCLCEWLPDLVCCCQGLNWSAWPLSCACHNGSTGVGSWEQAGLGLQDPPSRMAVKDGPCVVFP